MSRVGKMPIAIPQGVDVAVTAEQISVKGAQGALVRAQNALVQVAADKWSTDLRPGQRDR
jgi:large subunit ribosomal protein L6